jgi:hypothetical protein
MQIGKKISHQNIFLAGIILLAIALPFSNFLMSVAQIILVANWLLEGDLKFKLKSFAQNKLALVLSMVLLMHIVGLAYSSDWDYGLNDIKKKAPLFLLPLIFSTSKKLEKVQFELVLKLFIAAVLVATLYSTLVLFGITGVEITDIRQISRFISHIRFSLMISFSTLLCAYFFKVSASKHKVFLAITIAWFVMFLVLMESLTGLITLSAGIFLILFKLMAEQSSRALKMVGFAFLLTLLLSPAAYLAWELRQYYNVKPLDPATMEKFTSKGAPYYHEYESEEIENGNYVRVYIAQDELAEAWRNRSAFPFDSLDRKGHFLEYTIYRFLTSKGLRKDADGLSALTDSEIFAIENGIANVDYQDKSSLRDRIRQLIWEVDWYFKSYNPTGHSLTMRLEFWKIAGGIVREHPFIGVGTGDVPAAFESGYQQSNTQLGKDYWHRSHNQFLAIAVALGILGLLYFIFSLVYPFYATTNSRSYFYLCFFVIAIMSMFTEDTLETQAGISFFTFFTSFLLFLPKAEVPGKD